MASFSVSGVDEIASAFTKSANVPEDIKIKVLESMGEVVLQAQKQEGEQWKDKDPFYDGQTHFIDAIKLKKPKLEGDGGSVKITFDGKRRRGRKETRNAEIAFINEFGKKNFPARQFIKKANEKSADKASNAGADVLHNWIESNFN